MAGGYEQVLKSENVDPKLLGQRNIGNHAILDAQVNTNFLNLIAFNCYVSNIWVIITCSTYKRYNLYTLIKSIRLEQETEKLFGSMYFYVQL